MVRSSRSNVSFIAEETHGSPAGDEDVGDPWIEGKGILEQENSISNFISRVSGLMAASAVPSSHRCARVSVRLSLSFVLLDPNVDGTSI